MPKCEILVVKITNNLRRDEGGKFEMLSGNGDQNSEKHLKISKVVKQETCPLKT